MLKHLSSKCEWKSVDPQNRYSRLSGTKSHSWFGRSPEYVATTGLQEIQYKYPAVDTRIFYFQCQFFLLNNRKIEKKQNRGNL